MCPDGKSLKKKWLFKVIVVGLFLLTLFLVVYFGRVQYPRASPYRPLQYGGLNDFLKGKIIIPVEDQSDGGSASISPEFHFDPHGNDTLVLVHIQKTGGTEFLRYLVTVKRGSEYLCNISSIVKRSIEKKRNIPRQAKPRVRNRRGKKSKKREIVSCPRYPSKDQGEQWLISEKTMSWICGPHPSYTEYRRCLPQLDLKRFNKKRKLHYAVLLRHPVLRYISEYLHVQRNATWAARHYCKGKLVPLEDMPPCYPGFYNKVPWPNLTLSSFLSCESNWANNRQTLMLADIEAVNCFDKKSIGKEKREQKLLQTAKKNMESFAFFGITEYMDESCRMFENHFNMKFPMKPPKRNLSDLHSGPMLPTLWKNPAFLRAIRQVNHLDMALYEHALKLFDERARTMGIKINRNRVEEEVAILTTNPLLLVKGKHKKLNFTIS